MKELIEPYKNQIAATIILLAALFVAWNFPAENQYYRGADEGNYYRQGKILADNGLAGFSKMAKVYIGTPELQDAPHPLRLTAMIATALSLSVSDSFHAISVFCLLNFMLLLGVTFVFIQRFWGTSVALLTILLMATSPLEMAMARRALMDMPSLTAMAFSCYAFWLLIDTGKKKYLIALIVLMWYSILLKEANIMLLPFFGLSFLFLKWKKETNLSFIEIVIATLAPALLTVLSYVVAFGYDDAVLVVKALNNAASHSGYTALWGQGPWYRVLLDYIMVSPFAIVLAIAFLGYRLFSGNIDKNTLFVFSLSLYLLLFFILLPKNLRYWILLDLPIRFMAASFLLLVFNFFQQKKLLWVSAVSLLLLVALDVKSFQNYFLENAIYDPISYNLLTANKIIPPINYNQTTTTTQAQSTAIVNAKNAVQSNPTAENYVALGLAYYNEGQFLECVMANREVVRLQPRNATAYCNTCAAFNSIKDWNHAIEACTEALKIDSSFQLAKNNLNWAKSQAALEKK